MIEYIHPNCLAAWEHNPRTKIETRELQPLIDSMRAVGWFGAIMVRPMPGEDAGRYQVIAGERRWRAACAVGLEKIACEVRAISDKEAIEITVIENRDREDLNAIEEAMGYRKMLDLGWDVKEVSARCGLSEGNIYVKLRLLDLDEESQAAVIEEKISYTTAEALLRIEDEEKRKEARKRIAEPPTQDTPLSQKHALLLIQREYLDPQKRQKAWDKKVKMLRKEHGMDIDIATVAEAGKFTGWQGGYVRCDEKVPEWQRAVHAREMEDEEVPTWGDLAEKHGARKVAVPNHDGVPVFYVLEEPLVTAEQVLGENDPKSCIFPLAGNGRHEQSLAAEQKHEEEKVDYQAELEEREVLQGAMIRRLHEGLFSTGEARFSPEREQRTFKAMMQACVRLDLLEGLDAVPAAMGIDLEALGDGDAVAGMERWVERELDQCSVGACAFLVLAYGVANVFPGGYRAAEIFAELREALGADDEAPANEAGKDDQEEVAERDAEERARMIDDLLSELEQQTPKLQRRKRLAEMAEQHGKEILREMLSYSEWNEPDKHLLKVLGDAAGVEKK